MRVKDQSRADGPVRKRTGCVSIRHLLPRCSGAPARCRGLASFVMTASLLTCLCQQFEMALLVLPSRVHVMCA